MQTHAYVSDPPVKIRHPTPEYLTALEFNHPRMGREETRQRGCLKRGKLKLKQGPAPYPPDVVAEKVREILAAFDA